MMSPTGLGSNIMKQLRRRRTTGCCEAPTRFAVLLFHREGRGVVKKRGVERKRDKRALHRHGPFLAF